MSPFKEFAFTIFSASAKCIKTKMDKREEEGYIINKEMVEEIINEIIKELNENAK